MKYESGKTGRVFIAKFEDGENPLKELSELSKKEGIKAAVFWLVGGLKGGRFVVGPEDDTLPPKPIWREIIGNNEIVAAGTIFWYGEEPRIHMHGVYGREDTVRMGCLREDSQVFLVLEAIVLEIVDVQARRELDQKSGMVLLKIDD